MDVNDSHDNIDGEPGQPLATRVNWWLIGLGAGLLTMPVVGLAVSILGMISSFESIATSPTQPRPDELAEGIGASLFYTFAGFSLALIGIVLIVVGVIVRRPVASK